MKHSVASITPNVSQTPPSIPTFTPDVPIVTPNSSFECTTCGKTYTRKEKLTAHTPKCTGVANTLECPRCHILLTSYNAKSRHLKKCTGQTVQQAISHTTINNHTINNNTVNNVTNIQYNCNVKPNILPFGKENLSYINEDFIYTKIKDSNRYGVKDLIEAIYINPEHPENRNVWFGTGPSDSQNICFIMLEDGEHMMAFSEVMHMMCVNTYNIMTNLLDKKYEAARTSTVLTVQEKAQEHDNIQIYRDRVRKFGCEKGRRTPEYFINHKSVLVSLRDAAKGIYNPVHPLISTRTSETQKPLESPQVF